MQSVWVIAPVTPGIQVRESSGWDERGACGIFLPTVPSLLEIKAGETFSTHVVGSVGDCFEPGKQYRLRFHIYSNNFDISEVTDPEQTEFLLLPEQERVSNVFLVNP